MVEILIFIFTIGFLALLSPGPDFFLILRNSLSQSRGYALATAMGITAGILFHTIYCVLGLGLVISKNVVAFQILKYLGALYLVFLGIQTLLLRKKSRSTEIKNYDLHLKQTPLRGFLEGFLCNVLNVKASLFMISVFTLIITPETAFLHKSFYGLVFILQNVFYWSLLVFVLQKEKSRKIMEKIQGKAQIAFALVLFFFAFHIAFATP